MSARQRILFFMAGGRGQNQGPDCFGLYKLTKKMAVKHYFPEKNENDPGLWSKHNPGSGQWFFRQMRLFRKDNLVESDYYSAGGG